MIERFESIVRDEDIEDLRQRVAATRWPEFLRESGWTYGADNSFFREIATYWVNDFDWRKHERRWNELPQYLFTEGTNRIHLLHVRSNARNSMPLVLTHGWPGSFLEFLKILPLLTDPEAHGGSAEDAFDVVIPSLPGFGFSGPTHRLGVNTFETARLWVALMKQLGYDSFVAQGGDIGASVSTILAWKHPNSVVAFHLNYIPGSYAPYVADANELTPEERQFRTDIEKWAAENGAYAHLHRNQPELAAIALNDSPMGLAGWIIEKFRSWSDCGGDVEKRFSKDELVANVSLYWFTRTAVSSMRMYAENAKMPVRFGKGERVTVPCGIARFPKEAPFPPRSWIERAYNVQYWAEMASGGHFAALEEPDALARELRTFFHRFRTRR